MHSPENLAVVPNMAVNLVKSERSHQKASKPSAHLLTGATPTSSRPRGPVCLQIKPNRMRLAWELEEMRLRGRRRRLTLLR
jgi:hypothetical protein